MKTSILLCTALATASGRRSSRGRLNKAERPTSGGHGQHFDYGYDDYDYGRPTHDNYDYDQSNYDNYDYDRPTHDNYDYDQSNYDNYDYGRPTHDNYDYDRPTHDNYDYDRPTHDNYDYDRPTHDNYDYDRPTHDNYDYDRPTHHDYDYDRPTHHDYDYGRPTHDDDMPTYDDNYEIIYDDFDHGTHGHGGYDDMYDGDDWFEPDFDDFGHIMHHGYMSPHIMCHDGGFELWCGSSWEQKRACVYARNTVNSAVEKLHKVMDEEKPHTDLLIDTLEGSRVVAINTTDAATLYDGIRFDTKNVSATAPSLWEELQFGDGFVFAMEETTSGEGYGKQHFMYQCVVHWTEIEEEEDEQPPIEIEPPVDPTIAPMSKKLHARLRLGKSRKEGPGGYDEDKPDKWDDWNDSEWDESCPREQTMLIAVKIPIF